MLLPDLKLWPAMLQSYIYIYIERGVRLRAAMGHVRGSLASKQRLLGFWGCTIKRPPATSSPGWSAI